MYITKSLFVDYRKLPKLARWKAHDPETYKRIRKLEDEEQEKHIMEIGMAVEDAVLTFFEEKYGVEPIDLMPGLVKKSSSEEEGDDEDDYIQQPNFNPHQLMQDTLNAIGREEKVLYQPTFLINNYLVRGDIMVRNLDGTYTLCEIKAKTTVRKDVTDDGEKKPIGQIKQDLMDDMSFQKWVINQVLEREGLPLLESVQLRHLNKEYIKQGDLSLNLLLSYQDTDTEATHDIIQRKKPTKKIISDFLLGSDEIAQVVEQMEKFLLLTEEEFNKASLRRGQKYLEYFGEAKTEKYGTVMGTGIHHSNASTIQDLYYQGSHNLSQLTDDAIEQFNAGGKKFIHKYRQAKEQNAPIIDSTAINEVIDCFTYPICFYDYESISVPIPFMDNTFPYQQVVTQYSLHKLYEDGSLKHYGGVFVGEGEKCVDHLTIENNSNAVGFESEKVVTGEYKDLLVQFLEDIGEDINHSTFIVRHEGFENTRNKEIAKVFPDLSDYLKINDLTYDLKKIFEKGYYFDTGFKGSASIKKVLPVLVPEMSYDQLDDVQNGLVAMKRLLDLITDKIPQDQRETTIINLLKYCGQDSLAMVKIFKRIA